jgi:hypothetical protein
VTVPTKEAARRAPRRTPEAIAQEIQEIEDAPFARSDAGNTLLRELHAELNEDVRETLLDTNAARQELEAATAAVTALASEAVACVELFVAARDALPAAHERLANARRVAGRAGIQVGPRPNIAPPIALTHRFQRHAQAGWF